jgi:hypothetical protein
MVIFKLHDTYLEITHNACRLTLLSKSETLDT